MDVINPPDNASRASRSGFTTSRKSSAMAKSSKKQRHLSITAMVDKFRQRKSVSGFSNWKPDTLGSPNLNSKAKSDQTGRRCSIKKARKYEQSIAGPSREMTFFMESFSPRAQSDKHDFILSDYQETDTANDDTISETCITKICLKTDKDTSCAKMNAFDYNLPCIQTQTAAQHRRERPALVSMDFPRSSTNTPRLRMKPSVRLHGYCPEMKRQIADTRKAYDLANHPQNNGHTQEEKFSTETFGLDI